MAQAFSNTPGVFWGGRISFPSRSLWNLWLTKRQWDNFLRVVRFYPCQYHSDNAPYSLIHLYPILCNPGSWRRRDITHLKTSKQVLSFKSKFTNMAAVQYVVGSKSFRPDIQKPRQMDKEPEYFLKGLHLLVHRFEKCVDIKGDYIEKKQSYFISVTLKGWSGRKRLDPPS